MTDTRAYAHSLPGQPHDRWERLADHLSDVAVLADRFARPFGCAAMARLAGLLHDIGKRSAEYQRYIRTPGAERGPDHSTAGAIEANRRYGALGRLIAFAVAGHHGGLLDGAATRGAGFDARLTKAGVPDYAGWETEVGDLPDPAAIAGVLPRRAGYVWPDGYPQAFLGRMIFSCLVDADFLATEAFMARGDGRTVARGNDTPLTVLCDRLDAHMARFAGAGGVLNALRAEILAHARARADDDPGLFTMTVPTGGGKTLASLAFALDHAVRHDLARVIYVVPYTSIIEQTAQIFRGVLGEENVLEHHGNVDWDRVNRDDEGADGRHKLRRAAENWDAPVIVTTAVQFFESLHAARPSRCRKLHNLARSVMILDEAQTMPVQLLRPCMAAIAELAGHYGSTVVLCTATQPALRRQDGLAGGLDIPDDRELAPRPRALYDALKRVTVERIDADDATIAARFAERPQMLCIVNSRAHAQDLFALIRDLDGARHLTTLMCPAHRRAVLDAVRADLKAGQPVRLVSTSLIEAGVDIDLPEVWRAETGLDAIARGSVDRNIADTRKPVNVPVSLPAREHGSKLRAHDAYASCLRSLPARERGSKQREFAEAVEVRPVAPRAGAWIETGVSGSLQLRTVVAPRAGAWIETCSFPSPSIWVARCSARGSVDRAYRSDGKPRVSVIA